MYTDYTLQQQMNKLPFMQGPLDPALMQDYINSQNLQIQDPSLRQQPMQQPQQGVQLAGPMVPGALPTQPPTAPQQSVNQQTQPPATQPAMQAQPTQPPAQQPQQPQEQQPQPGSAEYMNQEAQNVSNPIPDHANIYGQIQQDPTALLNYAKDSNVPEHFRTQAITRAGDLLAQNKAKNEAIQQVATMQPNDLANALKERTTNGSWPKAIIYGLLGMHNMAQDEAAKLGIGKDTPIIGSDGKAYLIKMAANGTPLEGFSSETGKKLTPSELVDVAANGTMQKGRETHTGKMQDVTTKEIYYEQTTPNGIRLVSPSGKTYTGSTANLRAYGIGSDIDTKNQIQLNELQNKLAYVAPTEKSKVIAQHEATYGPLDPATRTKLLQGQPLPPVVGTVGQTVPQQAQPIIQPQPSVQQRQNMPVAPNVQGSPLPSGLPLGIPGQAPTLPQTNAQGKVITPVAPTTPQFIGGTNGLTPAQVKQNMELQKKQGEENINVTGKRSESFNKYVDETVAPEADKGEVVRNNRKQQFDLLKQTDEFGKPIDEQIAGLYNAANQDPTNQKWSIIRDIVAGKALPENDASKRIAQLDITPKTKALLLQYNALNAQIAAQTLRETSGPGGVSDAEQAANRSRNVDITNTPLLGVYQMMAQSQFNGDLARYKSAVAAQTDAPNRSVFDQEFRKQSTPLVSMYRDIAQKRLEYIQKNGNTPTAIRNGYKFYPIPEYDVNTGQWINTKPLGEILK